jgi:hypothetical protein
VKISPNTIPIWSRWLLPSLNGIILLSILLWILGAYGLGLLNDADTGMHIRTGEYILDHGTIPTVDPFSYTKANETWIVHSWLSAVFFSIIHRLFGLHGVVFVSTFIISITFVFLFRCLIRRRVDLLTAVLLVILAVSASLFYGFSRPHIFTALLVLIWYDRLDRYKTEGNRSVLLLLPLLMVLWVNLHGGYIVGFFLILIFLSGEVLDLFLLPGPIEKAGAKMRIRSLGGVTSVCLLFSLMNPYGYKILAFPFQVASNTYIQQAIIEWQSPSFHKNQFIPFEAALLLLVVVLGWSSKRMTLTDLGIILFWTHAALFSARHIPVFAVIFALVMGPRLTFGKEPPLKIPALLKGYRNLSERLGVFNRLSRYHMIAILVFLSIFSLMIFTKRFDTISGLQGQFNPKNLPVQAATFIEDSGLSGPMYNHIEFGGYLIYALFPDYKVFVDRRADMYGEDFMKEYKRVEEFKPGWREIMERYEVNWVIGHTRSASSTFFHAVKDWKLIYSDETASIFIRNVPENEATILRYLNVDLKVGTDLF